MTNAKVIKTPPLSGNLYVNSSLSPHAYVDSLQRPVAKAPQKHSYSASFARKRLNYVYSLVTVQGAGVHDTAKHVT